MWFKGLRCLILPKTENKVSHLKIYNMHLRNLASPLAKPTPNCL